MENKSTPTKKRYRGGFACILNNMKTCPRSLMALVISLFATAALSQPNSLAIASFNLGWWVDSSEFSQMLKNCSQTPSVAAEGLPPCNVYPISQGRGSQTQVILTPTVAYWEAKRTALRNTLQRVNADVVAFEEVSGMAAAQAVIGSPADPYLFCESALRDPQIPEAQRLVIAARQSAFQNLTCRTDDALRVLDKNTQRYVRPALIAELRTKEGKALKVIALHLKSRCASPVGDEKFSLSGDLLTSKSTHCITLRDQVAPLEQLIEREVTTGQSVIVLGDFNRKIDLELDRRIGPAREQTAGSAPGADLSGKGIPNTSDHVRLLWPEVNDGDPPASHLRILPTEPRNAGCTGFEGLDHITVSTRLQTANPIARGEHVAMASFGGADDILPASDHCPLRARLQLP